MKIQIESRISSHTCSSLLSERGHRGRIDHGAARAERLHLLLPCRSFPNLLEPAFLLTTRTSSPSARCRRARRAVSPCRCSPWPPAVLAPSSSHFHPPSAPIDLGNGFISFQWSSQARPPLHIVADEPPPRTESTPAVCFRGGPSSGLPQAKSTLQRPSPGHRGALRLAPHRPRSLEHHRRRASSPPAALLRRAAPSVRVRDPQDPPEVAREPLSLFPLGLPTAGDPTPRKRRRRPCSVLVCRPGTSGLNSRKPGGLSA